MMEHNNENFVYFLVDTTQLEDYRAIYLQAIRQIASETETVANMVLITYGSLHCYETVHPQAAPEITPLTLEQAEEQLQQMTGTHRGRMGSATLKMFLHQLLTYLADKDDGEIHILAPDTPNEQNTCRFSVYTTEDNGTIVETYYSGGQLLETFGTPTTKVFVHTFDDDGATKRERWYTVMPLPEERPALLQGVTDVNDLTQAEINLSLTFSAKSQRDTSTKNVVRKKGRGFFLVGGRR